MIIPKSLTEGSTIAVVSPSSIIKPQNVYKALPVLNDQGWKTVTGEHAFDRKGTFAGTPEVRYSDFAAALRAMPFCAHAAATALSIFSNSSTGYRSKSIPSG
jgi:muramoyltetrapeptide carboxypeptidase LdcA involved in peptidoglycan recycling